MLLASLDHVVDVSGHGCFGAFGGGCPGAMVRSCGKCWTRWTAPIFDSSEMAEGRRCFGPHQDGTRSAGTLCCEGPKR